MSNNLGPFRRLPTAGASSNVNVQPVDTFSIGPGVTQVLPLPTPSINKVLISDGTNSLLTTISYAAPDGAVYGDIGTRFNIQILPTAAGLQVTNNEAVALTINIWRI